MPKQTGRSVRHGAEETSTANGRLLQVPGAGENARARPGREDIARAGDPPLATSY